MKNLRWLVWVFILIIVFQAATALEVSVSDYDPKPAEAGKAVNVWFKVENPIERAEEDINIEITPKDGLQLTSGEESNKRIGLLPARSSQTVRFRLLVRSDAFEGSHNMEVRLLRGSNAISKKTLSIEVTEKDFKDVDLAVGDVESDPSRIKPDDENVRLEVTIQNLGDGNAQGVKAELISLPEGVTLSESYSGTSLLGNIEADSTSTAVFYIDVGRDVKPQQYTAQIKTSYKYKPDESEDEYLFEEKDIPLNLAIKPVPLFEIVKAELSQAVLKAGDEGIKLRLTVKNIGEEKGESVRVKVYGKTEQPFKFDKASDFVAPILESGESGQGTLEFKIDDDANLQKYYLDIEIKTLVGDDVLTYSEKVPITVSKQKPNNPWGIVSIGFVLIAGFLSYWGFKKYKSRRKRPEAKKIEGSYGSSYLEKMKDEE